MNQGSFGESLRQWRKKRNLSQQVLADRASISCRHLSFLETGRSNPSRDMVERLARAIDMPVGARKKLFSLAGFSAGPSNTSKADTETREVTKLVALILETQSPFPALAFDRHYNVVAMNDSVRALMGELPSQLLSPKLNVYRLALHPLGMASRIVNFNQVRRYVTQSLQRHLELTGDEKLTELFAEIKSYAAPATNQGGDHLDHEYPGALVPFRVRTSFGILTFYATFTVIYPQHQGAQNRLVIEAFYPADVLTRNTLERVARQIADHTPDGIK